MPTVLIVNGFQVMIYTHDHEPEHVHVFKGGDEVIISLIDLSVRACYDMKVRDVRAAQQIVGENQEFLQAEWKRIDPIA